MSKLSKRIDRLVTQMTPDLSQWSDAELEQFIDNDPKVGAVLRGMSDEDLQALAEGRWNDMGEAARRAIGEAEAQ